MTGSIRTVVVLVLLSAPGLAGQGSEIPGYPQSAGRGEPGPFRRGCGGLHPMGVQCKGQPEGHVLLDGVGQPAGMLRSGTATSSRMRTVTWTAGVRRGVGSGHRHAHGGLGTEARKQRKKTGRLVKGKAQGRWGLPRPGRGDRRGRLV